jgi:molecular chaperone DnaJ
MNFATLIGGQSHFFFTPNSGNVNHWNWLMLGVINHSFGAERSFHGTAHLASKDYYEILGVSSDASSSEIKKAFHERAKKYHPDVNTDDPEAKIKFQDAHKAYDVLKDKETRAQYDQVGHENFEAAASRGEGSHWDSNPFDNDIFGIFGNRGGRDVEVSLELSFMEAVQGCTKTVTYEAEVACESCGGKGVPPGTRPETCKRCKGAGLIMQDTGVIKFQMACTHCGGTGKFVKDMCKSCNGHRVQMGKKTVKLDIMPGVDNDQTLKKSRFGGVDPDGNSQPGDLFVNIRVREDPIFRREGPDIHVNAVLSFNQAILGTTIKVPSLTGDIVLKVRPGTQPGQKVVLKKKGIKTRTSFSFGDQYVRFNVTIPTDLTEKQKKLIEEFGKDEKKEYETSAAAAASR